MTIEDHYGNRLGTTIAAARDNYDQGVRLFLAGMFGAVEAFTDAVNLDPGFALGHAARARGLMMAGDMAEARKAIETAKALSDGLSDRETSHINAMALLLSGRAAEARAAVLAHVQTWPRDAMAAQMCTNVFGLIGFSGEVGREAALLAYTSALLPHYGEDWWMMSMHALSLCETGQIDASLALMERSLALNPENANASHFKAHAQYEAGETEAGRAFLGEWIQGYDARGVLHGHLTWHLALWALHAGDADEMWARVDAGVAPGTSHSLPINVLTDTAAIYFRAELAGIPVEARRWRTLSAYAANYFPETGQSFADMHAALSHAMAGDGTRLAYIADTAKGFAGDLVRPVAQAWGAMARAEWADALAALKPLLPVSERVGGSRAQRDLIELSYVHVLLKLGQRAEADRVLHMRRPQLAGNPPLAAMA